MKSATEINRTGEGSKCSLVQVRASESVPTVECEGVEFGIS